MGRYTLKFGSIGQAVTYDEGEPRSYTDEWKRSNPDYVVYLPQRFIRHDTDNVHFLVVVTTKGNLIGTWCQGTYEAADNSCVMMARSEDEGETWSQPYEIDGPNEARYHCAFYGFPIVSDSGRIYVFYIKRQEHCDFNSNTHGVMRCRYSDDEGKTWTPPVEIPMKRRPWDHPDPKIPSLWVGWANAIRDAKGRQLWAYGRWNHYNDRYPKDRAFLEFMRFDNIDEGPNPKELQITWLPESPITGLPKGGMEPCPVLLPDGRLFTVFRTGVGSVWHTISEDDGATWRQPEPLRYQDGGERVLNPGSPPPLFALEDGRFLQQYHNNDGSASSGPQPMWARPYSFSRRSLFLSVGAYRPKARQPIWFSPPKLLADSDGVSAGVQNRTEMGTYDSLTERNGKRILWYPDRKHFLLGKRITDEWLADMNVPEV
jgi:hypothetical protein